MTSGGSVDVEGADLLAATLDRASDDLQDFSRAGSKTGTLIANRGRTEAPRLTGRLAGSITTDTDANDTEILSALPYANRVHWGYARVGQRAQPFLLNPANQLAPVWSGFYQDEAERVLHTVKGA